MGPAELIENYQARGVLLDTNLLVLLVVGLYRRDRISTFHRTTKYTEEDFLFLVRLVDRFTRRITTPHILTEVDNLARQLPTREHAPLSAGIVRLISELFEVYVPSANAMQEARYPDLGLTDCVTIAASDDALVLTDDFRLSQVLTHLGRASVNINHIRTYYWN